MAKKKSTPEPEPAYEPDVYDRARERVKFEVVEDWSLKARHHGMWSDHVESKRVADFMLCLAILIADRLAEDLPVPDKLVDEYQLAKLAYEAQITALNLGKDMMREAARRL